MILRWRRRRFPSRTRVATSAHGSASPGAERWTDQRPPPAGKKGFSLSPHTCNTHTLSVSVSLPLPQHTHTLSLTHSHVQVSNARRGLPASEHALAALLQSMVDMCADEDKHTVVYVRDFETPFLEETHRQFEAESRAFLAANGARDYVQWAAQRLDSELLRSEVVLRPFSQPKLLQTCAAALVTDHIDDLNSHAQVRRGRTVFELAVQALPQPCWRRRARTHTPSFCCIVHGLRCRCLQQELHDQLQQFQEHFPAVGSRSLHHHVPD